MTDEQTKPKWGGAYGLPSGHRLFYDTAAGATRVAIADDSANQPQDTDDGILWLDQDQAIIVNYDWEGGSIPVTRDSDGERFSIKVNTATVLDLSRQFRWTIEDVDGGKFYNVR
jgi:hypothetical protein